jgi:hypothetical protein
MLCDLAAVDPRGIAAAVEQVVIAGLVLPTGLRALVDRHGRPGRTGIAALQRAVESWPLGDKPAGNVLEPAIARLLADHGLPPAEFHPIIEGLEVDFRIVGTPVVVECDGWEFHVTSRVQFALDRERDAVLSAAGYVVVRVTWEHVVRRAGATARRIESVIRRWSPSALDAPASSVRLVSGSDAQRRRDAGDRRSAWADSALRKSG